MSKIKKYFDKLMGTTTLKMGKYKVVLSTKSKSIIATLLLIAGGLGLFGTACRKKEKSETPNDKPQTTTQTSDVSSVEIEEVTLGDLGVELPQNKTEKKEYGSTSKGVADPNKVVKDKETGKIYVDKEAHDKKGEVGTTVIDTKNDTLVVKKDETTGEEKVFEKEESVVIKDEDGNVKQEEKIDKETKYTPDGTPIPDGYAWDDVRKKIVPESEVGKYVIDEEGNIVLKEEYEANKNVEEEVVVKEEVIEVTTNKEEKTLNSQTNSSKPKEVVDTGIINQNGTYTISGLTFETKADYQQWIIQGFTGYVIDVDGIIKAEESLSNTLVK